MTAKCYRAYVRGKVEGLHSIAEIGDPAEREAAAANARRYFQLAPQYVVAGVASDARSEDHDVLNKAYEPPDELPADHKYRVTTDVTVHRILHHLLLAISSEPCRSRHQAQTTDPACGRTRDPSFDGRVKK